MLSDALGCSTVFKDALGCSRMLLKRGGFLETATLNRWRHRPHRFNFNEEVLGCLRMLWDALGCSGMIWDALGCSTETRLKLKADDACRRSLRLSRHRPTVKSPPFSSSLSFSIEFIP